MTTDSRDGATGAAALPGYLSGHLAPVTDELHVARLSVEGALPPELAGRYVRNGPNPLPGEDPGHWFPGHGMLHGIRINNGVAEWYRNRWVRTGKFAGRPVMQADGMRDLAVHAANTHVITHADRLFALGSGLPYEVTPELDTLGPCDFGGRLATAMTPHPKEDPVTGELVFFGYSPVAPYLTYYRLSADGELVHVAPIKVPGPTLMHDFAVTEHYVVWMDLPVVLDSTLVGTGVPFRWDDSYGARLGIMPRDGASGDVRWVEVEPCYVFHVGNACEDAAGTVVLDVVRYDRAAWAQGWSAIGGHESGVRPGRVVGAAASTGVSCLYRWSVHPATGVVRERQLDDRGIEFPTLNDARLGRENRYLYVVADSLTSRESPRIIRYDMRHGTSSAHRVEPDLQPGEAVFVPARDATAEDEGWLLTIVTDRAARASALLVLDASAVTAAPVATVSLPRAVPAGFHGSWIPDDDTSAHALARRFA